MKEKRTRRKFTNEFKVQAVELAASMGLLSQAAECLLYQ